MIRKAIPDATVGFFLHTPFPSSEIFRCLPKRKEVLQGLLGSNLVGFQTYSYARHFISSCTRVLGLESSPKGVEYKGNVVQVGIFPIGIDVNKVEEKRYAPFYSAFSSRLIVNLFPLENLPVLLKRLAPSVKCMPAKKSS